MVISNTMEFFRAGSRFAQIQKESMYIGGFMKYLLPYLQELTLAFNNQSSNGVKKLLLNTGESSKKVF